MAKKTTEAHTMPTNPAAGPVGAGDLGATVRHLREAAAAFSAGDYGAGLAALWGVLDEVRKAFQGDLSLARAGDPKKAAALKKEAAKLTKLADRLEKRPKGAAAIPWAQILAVVLAMLQAMFQQKA